MIIIQTIQVKEDFQNMLRERILRMILNMRDRTDPFSSISSIRGSLICRKKGKKCSK
jgi:hypothetical protein